MAKVTSIMAARSRQKDGGAFSEALAARGNQVKNTISCLTNTDIIDLTLPDIRISTTPTALGHVSIISPRTVEPVITDEGLPRVLENFPEIGSKAIQFAADYVLAYGIAVKALHRQTVRITEPNRPEVWAEAYRNLDVPHRFEMPYRFAGCIALASSDIEPLEVPTSIPERGLPPHLASLFDPYSEHALRGFSSAMSYTMSTQRRQERGPIC